MSLYQHALRAAADNKAREQAQIVQELKDLLPALGISQSFLAGERAEARKRNQPIENGDKYSKPNARVRLFCFYGAADASISLQKWITSAPDWLEIRVVELPGHGYLTEGLPSCSFQCSDPLTNSELEEQRSEWIRSFADQIEPILLNKNQQAISYAFYGFSLGAILAYLLCLELEKRGSTPPPLALFSCGRGAPHAILHTNLLQQNLQRWSGDRILDFMESKLGIPTSLISPSRKERMSALFRCGMLFSGLYVGENWDDSKHDLWDDVNAPIPHATNPPVLNCPVISLSGSLDVVWPSKLVEKWSESTLHRFQHFSLDGISHLRLMNAREAKDAVFDELARLALEKGRSIK